MGNGEKRGSFGWGMYVAYSAVTLWFVVLESLISLAAPAAEEHSLQMATRLEQKDHPKNLKNKMLFVEKKSFAYA